VRIIELDAIATLLEQGFAVIACGGGGIPIIENENGNYVGVEAVIDKDLASSLLARELRAEKFVISTDVPKIALNFNQSNQKWLDRIILSEARRLSAEGHFDRGSMGPKVRAMIEFVEAHGGEGIITNPPNILDSLAGKCGTRIVSK
jgi:carbamate kinase